MARALCSIWGIGVPEDNDAGFRMLNTECDTSDPHVQYLLGICHRNGHGCVKNDTQAIQCYERAGNHVSALTNLGFMVVNGHGVAQDDSRAVALYRHAAEQGHSNAQYNLANVYEQGKGVRKDRQQAKHLYTLAAQQGHENAKKVLELMSLSGI
eukprot:TRINITY_DN5329_c2_g1_i1.p1 TRINITY_DN5329_c2_g1~~TRINITY_DN5329_c2_g1_i1.p1  ORF type:complete len:154 (-),score=35.73 TRINITY_DN5329_c2_g1_i1:33-494(-)